MDGALVAGAYSLAFQLRFDNGPTGRYDKLFERTVWWVLAGSLVVLLASRVYQRRWRYSGQRDYEAVARAVVAIVLLTVVAIEVVRPVKIPHNGGTLAVGLPNGVIALFFLLSLLLLVGVRVLARSLYERRPLGGFRPGARGERNVLIVGAGDGGRLVLREILRNRELGLRPVGFVDDDPRKRGLRIDGVKVRGDTEGSCRGSSTSPSPTKSSSRSPPRPAPRARASCGSAVAARCQCARCPRSSSCCRIRARSHGRCARCVSRTCSAASRF